MISGILTRTEQALLLGLGSSFFVYGAAQWTGFVTYTPPAIVYIIVGIVALLWVCQLTVVHDMARLSPQIRFITG